MQARYSESSWAVLAGLRFLLASIVFIGHLQFYMPLPQALQWLPHAGGRAAVLGFLLISGISVGHSYATRPMGYIQRRFLRIYPLYFFAVVGSAILNILIAAEATGPLLVVDWTVNVANLFFLQGFLSYTSPYNGALWSLGVEVFLYAMGPLLARASIGLLVVLIYLSLLAFFVPRQWLFGYLALRYSWPWLIGFLSATKGCPPLIFTFLGLGVLAVLLENADTTEVGSGFTFGMVAGAILLLNTYAVTIPRFLRRIFNFLGELSYPLYLFHLPLSFALYHYLAVQNAAIFIVVVPLVSILLNYLLDHWLKRIVWVPLVSWASGLLAGGVSKFRRPEALQ